MKYRIRKETLVGGRIIYNPEVKRCFFCKWDSIDYMVNFRNATSQYDAALDAIKMHKDSLVKKTEFLNIDHI